MSIFKKGDFALTVVHVGNANAGLQSNVATALIACFTVLPGYAVDLSVAFEYLPVALGLHVPARNEHSPDR